MTGSTTLSKSKPARSPAAASCDEPETPLSASNPPDPVVEMSPEMSSEPRRPRFYYGWVMVPVAMVTIIATAPGQTFGVSIFNEPMRTSLGLSHGQMALAYMLGTLFGSLPIPWIGRLIDRHGLRGVLVGVGVLFTVACWMTAGTQNWWMLVGSFFLLRMLGPGALSLISSTALAFWFERRLGLVEGIRQVGMAVSMAIIPTLNLALLDLSGWRGAYGLLGVAVFITLIPLAVLAFRNHPGEVGQSLDDHDRPLPDQKTDARHGASRRFRFAADPSPFVHADEGLTLGEAIRTFAFGTVAAGMSLYGLILTALFFCLVPIFEERSLSPESAAATLTVFATCLSVMQLVGGYLADRLAARSLLTWGVACLALAMALFYFARSESSAYFAGAILGVGQGIYFGVAQPLWARYFGRRHLGKIRGVLMTLAVSSSSLGPLFAGLCRDLMGQFDLAMIMFIIAPIPIAVLSAFVRPPRRLDSAPDHVPAVSSV